MAVHGGASEERPWSDLPGDLLSDIYLRSISAYDRARFAAVCSPWRAAAAWHLRLPALPLLLLSTGDGKRDREARAYSPEDGRTVRVPLPWFPWGNRLVGSYEGGWIATVSGSGGLLVVNVFSGARVERLSVENMNFIRKIVFSKDPSSAGCIMAAMTSPFTVELRRVGCPDSQWTTCCGERYLVDIAFCNGELYGISCGELIVFEVGLNKEGTLMAMSAFRIDFAMNLFPTAELSYVLKYIFALHGKLAIAVDVGPRGPGCERGHFFRVFELVDETMTSHKFTLAEVTTLGDHALFLGSVNCKAEHVSDQRGGVERNRIYYHKEHTYLYNSMARLDIGSCTVYCCKSESKHHLERVMSHGYHYRKNQDGVNGCVWLWPPDF
jgi:hypothetical protein